MLQVNQLTGFNVVSSSTLFGTVRTDTLGNTAQGNATVTFRHLFAAAGLTAPSGTITLTRVTFSAGTTGGEGLSISSAYIGHKAGAGDAYDFAATPVQITFDTGSSSVLISTGTDKLSDEVAFVWDKASDIIISCYCNSAGNDSGKYATGLSNVDQYYKVANDTSTVDATGYGVISGRLEFISKIEMNGF